MCDLRSSIDTWRTNNFQHKNKSRIACGSSSRWLWLTNPLLRHQNMQYLHTQRQCISQCHCLSSAIQAAVAFEFIDFLHPVPGSRLLRSKQICFSYANTTHSNQHTSQAAGRLSLLMLRLLVWSALRLLDLKKTSSPARWLGRMTKQQSPSEANYDGDDLFRFGFQFEHWLSHHLFAHCDVIGLD